MKTVVLDQKWKEVWEVDLNKSIFGLEMNEGLVHRALVYALANNRTNVAHTKTRWERRGSTRKIYRQKWTGRARMGSNRSPIRKKGWVAFGPRNTTNFTLSMNRKERRKALFCMLSAKVKNKELVILDNIKLKEIKTKSMLDVFNKVKYEKNLLLALDSKNEVIEKSTANIPFAKTVLVNYLNVKDLMKYKTLVLMKKSLENLEVLAK